MWLKSTIKIAYLMNIREHEVAIFRMAHTRTSVGFETNIALESPLRLVLAPIIQRPIYKPSSANISANLCLEIIYIFSYMASFLSGRVFWVIDASPSQMSCVSTSLLYGA